MRTSLTELERIENFLLQKSDHGERLLLEAQLKIDASLAEKVRWQRKTYQILQQYGRHQLRKEIHAVSQQLFTAPKHSGFKQKILSIFKKY